VRVVRSDQRIADKMLITAALIALGSITFPNVAIARRERAM
jgi:hypothetical protein